MSTQPRKPAGSPGSTGGQYDTTGRDILPSFFGAPGDDDQDRLDDQTHTLAIDAVAATDDPDSYAVRTRSDGHVLVGHTRTGRLSEIITDYVDAQIETLEDTLGPLADDERTSQQLLFSDRFDERIRVERERIEYQTGLYLRAADPSADLTNIAYAASLEDSTELKCAAIASGALKRDDLTRLAGDTDPLVASDARRALD